MAKHKAPTQVTIASTEEKTILHELVEKYWLPATGLALVVTAGVLGSQWMTLSGQADTEAQWDRLGEEVKFQNFGMLEAPSPDVLANLAEELGSSSAAASWAKAVEVNKRVEEGDFEGAGRALDELESEWPDHPMVNAKVYPEADGSMKTLRERLATRAAAVSSWEKEHTFLFENPTLPEDSPRVKLTTSAGDIVVGLYAERAPKHVENFLKHCREGFYDNVKFHRVIRDFMIQTGDPNTIDGEPDTWGQGGTDYKIEPEIDPQLRHFAGALAAAKKPGETESSGSQFYLTTGTPHHLDGQHTVFGLLVQGEDVVETIETGAVVGDRPEEPVVITGTTILE